MKSFRSEVCVIEYLRDVLTRYSIPPSKSFNFIYVIMQTSQSNIYILCVMWEEIITKLIMDEQKRPKRKKLVLLPGSTLTETSDTAK